jgi:putative endopeptidase
MKKNSCIWLVMPLAFAMSCKSKNQPSAADTVTKRTVFFDKTGMDTTIKPGDDFFSFANGS